MVNKFKNRLIRYKKIFTKNNTKILSNVQSCPMVVVPEMKKNDTKISKLQYFFQNSRVYNCKIKIFQTMKIVIKK